ncbi:nad(p)h-hydrate epimerase [Anaeramoeba ignava]|uniref:NAD(P)H-hydrate epimerase n=1 Tax=Anaeramoeba ignava TaxID=1746090 RepID=A0A9Q0LUY7_ANAIG|nr:nad(p)h-hydrate epimerase [Anaeramoeba ignava]
MSFLTQKVAQEIDDLLMNKMGYSVYSLMELAGLSCANAVYRILSEKKIEKGRVLVVSGPGNCGGDGLVAARHLHHFGCLVEVVYPKRPNKELFQNLIKQITGLEISLLDTMPEVGKVDSDYDYILDGIFGFSFNSKEGKIRSPFDKILDTLSKTSTPVASIDIPSGWDVEEGDILKTNLQPETLISLTAPKLCAKNFKGKYHFLGGRFLPESLCKKYEINLPKYKDTEQIIRL